MDMPKPAPSTSAVVGRSLIISALTMLVAAFLAYSGTLGLQQESRGLVAGALVVVAALDIAIGVYFLRRGRRS
jgi:hypothetical protein